MEANEVSSDLFGRDIKFTENGVRLPLGGEGLWYGMSGKGSYKFYVPDIETQQVAFIGTRARGRQDHHRRKAWWRLRCDSKISKDRIAEVEQLVIRPETPLGGAAANAPPPRFPPAAEAIEKMGAPNPVYREVIPEAKRRFARRADQDRQLLLRRPAAQRRQGLLPVHR